ncbi:hypothetical protein BC832DRAFT_565133 [Gaertneriomyces semiglobifer]|nr:hypothetical protein BC832DRAFT_565133 [Gaertneriomyces semiglobifer]
MSSRSCRIRWTCLLVFVFGNGVRSCSTYAFQSKYFAWGCSAIQSSISGICDMYTMAAMMGTEGFELNCSCSFLADATRFIDYMPFSRIFLAYVYKWI